MQLYQGKTYQIITMSKRVCMPQKSVFINIRYPKETIMCECRIFIFRKNDKNVFLKEH